VENLQGAGVDCRGLGEGLVPLLLKGEEFLAKKRVEFPLLYVLISFTAPLSQIMLPFHFPPFLFIPLSDLFILPLPPGRPGLAAAQPNG